jgi:hypothetical protein
MKILNALVLFFATALCITSALAQSPQSSATACQVYVSADDSFELFVNGTSAWKDSQFDKVVNKTILLKRGDVVTVTVTDQQGGQGGHFAAVLLRGESVVASSKDFRYTVDPAADFKTSSNIQGLRAPALETLQLSFGLGAKKQPKKAWTQKSDRNTGMVYFKLVMP